MPEVSNHRVDAVENAGSASHAAEPAAIEHIRQALNGLRFGTVSIIVQDGVVIQIERTEKRRLR
jgi:hypothetical protein